jgi:hypothetical protein
MKQHERKKAFRKFCKAQAKDGFINNASGQWMRRGSAGSSAMIRDYSPQSGK